jgi:serine/threonine protein kinase
MNNEEYANAYLSYVQNEHISSNHKQPINSSSAFGSKLEDYEIVKAIGRGSTGTVYKVISLKDGQVYALKKIETRHLSRDIVHKLWKEVAALKELQHPHIIKYFHSFIDDQSLCIITEFAWYGDLDKVLFVI